MSETINNGIPFVPENTIDPAAGLNLSLNVVDALLQLVVVTFGETVPPVGVEGERHIVGAGATGDWADEDNKMARYLDGAWHFYDAVQAVYDGHLYSFDGSAWTDVGAAAVAAHVAESDPHPQYLTETEADALYATTAQGALADTSVQPGDNVSDLTNDASYLVSGDLKTVNGEPVVGSGDITVSGTVATLTDVGDVNLTSLADGDTLSWDATASEWVNEPVGNVSTTLGALSDVSVPSPADGEVLAYNSSSGEWEATVVGSTGTVTSVAMTVPTGLTVSGSPITTNGTLAVEFDTGYSIPADTQQAAWVERSGDTITDITITRYTETINATAGATLDRSTGGIQRLNLGANITLNLSDLTAGQSVMYRVTGGTTYTLGYTGLGAWSDGNVPTLSATHYLEFVHDGVEVVGFDCGGR